MFIIHLEHAPDSIRGEMSLFSQEVAPFTFVSNASAKIREKLWADVIKIKNISAILICSAENEFGYTVKKYGMPTYDFQNCSGVNLINKSANERIRYIAHKLWAKLNPKKSLIDHLLETGIVSQNLMNGIFSPLVKRMSIMAGINEIDLKNQITFVCAMHDIGKAHPEFQGRDSETFDILEANNLDMQTVIKIRHEEYAAYCVIGNLFSNETDNKTKRALIQIVEMHHQKERRVKNPDTDFIDIPDKKKDEWIEIQKYIYNYIKNVFHFTELNFCKNLESKKDNFMLINAILGILITSDWIASNKEVFGNESINDYADIKEYLNIKDLAIKGFLLMQNLTHSSFPQAKTFKDIFDFPSINNIQRDVEKIVNTEDVKVMLIESGCGSGKTEAALYAASVMGYKNNLSGVYMGLPTGTSAEAIQNRVDVFLDKLHMDKTKLYTSKTMLLREDGAVPVWTDASRQRLMATSAVGTVDQVMTTARMVRFESVRMVGLSSKVLIIDEIHAYDAYMITTIERLLQLCTAIGVPVILLSATLPLQTKEKLFSSITGKKEEIHDGYPLISYVTSDNAFHEIRSNLSEPDKVIQCDFLPYLNNPEKISMQAVKNIEKGGCECVILNTVQDAVDVYDSIKNMVSDDCQVVLYHARMPEITKENKIKKILNWCGKDRKYRPTKAIIVGTQVLEQSIDIDVDYMITAICPIDLLFQRIGRYHRHSDAGTIRELTDISDTIQILVPEDDDYGANKKIYAQCYLKATESTLKRYNVLAIPSCIPELVNEIYSSTDIDTEMKDRIKVADSDTGNIDVSKGFKGLYSSCQRGYLSDIYINVRVSDFPTEQIAILNEKELSLITNPSENDYMELIKLFKEKVVTVNSRSIERFEDYEKDMESKGFFKNIKIYTNDNCISSDGIKKFSIDEEYGFRILDM